jgi:glyoxylase-like metal-dependent hydrolase (beta-lactamase superfamily II)
MDEVVPGVSIYSEFPRRYLNAYVVDDVLVDSGVRWWTDRFLRELEGHDVRAHALTHAHPDHQGKTARVCEALDVPLWCHEAERDAAERGATLDPMPDTLPSRLLDRFAGGPGHPVARTLSEGDSVGSFQVVETPGNAPGHVSLWRERDGTLLLGDVLASLDTRTFRRGLTTLPASFTADPAEAVRSARTVADLEPETVCFGHGPPLHDGTRFQEFVATLEE